MAEDGNKMLTAKYNSLSMKLWKLDSRGKSSNVPASRVSRLLSVIFQPYFQGPNLGPFPKEKYAPNFPNFSNEIVWHPFLE